MPLTRSLPTLLLLLILSIGGSACNSPFARACTLIGCSDGLTVQLAGELPAQYTVSVEVPGSGTPWVVECSTESPCNERIHFPEFTPSSVRITVSADGNVRTETFQPSYERVRPNGLDCPPECRQGSIRFQW